MSVGVFPLHCYESDSMHTIAGMNVLFNQGFTIPPAYSYEYNMQPLIYYVVYVFKYILPFLSCEQIFCLLTAIAAVLNVFFCIKFANRLTGLRKKMLLLAMFLLPESVAIGMYPNTAIFAMLPFMIALNFILDKKLIPAIFLMSLAALFRIDILMVYPVILPVFLWQKDNFLVAFKKSVVFAISIIAITALCYWGLQANPFGSTMDGYSKWNEKITLAQNFYAIFTFYTPVGFVLFVAGLFILIKRKQYILLFTLLLPILLNHIVYGRMACATKHFLYILPFVAICLAISVLSIYAWLKDKKVLKWSVATIIVLFLVASIRFSPSNRPWMNVPTAEGKIGPSFEILQENITPYKFSFGLGAGFLLSTADEKMLATGNLFYPFYIHNLKANRDKARKDAYQYLADKERYDICGITWEELIYYPLILQANGYRFDREKDFYVFTSKDEKNKVTVNRTSGDQDISESADERKQQIDAYFQEFKTVEEEVYLFSCTNSIMYFLDQFAEEGKVEKISRSFYLINPK